MKNKKLSSIVIILLMIINLITGVLLYKSTVETNKYKNESEALVGGIWSLLANEGFDYETDHVVNFLNKYIRLNDRDLLLKEEILSDILQEIKKGRNVKTEILNIVEDITPVEYYSDRGTNDYHNSNIMKMRSEILKYSK